MRKYLINFIELFYGDDEVYNYDMDIILQENGATEDDDADEEGLYHTMSDDQLKATAKSFLDLYGNKVPIAKYLWYVINDINQDYIAGFEDACKGLGVSVEEMKASIGL